MGGVVDQRSQWSRMVFSSNQSRVRAKTKKPTVVFPSSPSSIPRQTCFLLFCLLQAYRNDSEARPGPLVRSPLRSPFRFSHLLPRVLPSVSALLTFPFHSVIQTDCSSRGKRAKLDNDIDVKPLRAVKYEGDVKHLPEEQEQPILTAEALIQRARSTAYVRAPLIPLFSSIFAEAFPSFPLVDRHLHQSLSWSTTSDNRSSKCSRRPWRKSAAVAQRASPAFLPPCLSLR
jgi:hypothetical protein